MFKQLTRHRLGQTGKCLEHNIERGAYSYMQCLSQFLTLSYDSSNRIESLARMLFSPASAGDFRRNRNLEWLHEHCPFCQHGIWHAPAMVWFPEKRCLRAKRATCRAWRTKAKKNIVSCWEIKKDLVWKVSVGWGFSGRWVASDVVIPSFLTHCPHPA